MIESGDAPPEGRILADLLRSSMAGVEWVVVWQSAVESTMTVAREHLSEVRNGKHLVVVANRQDGGRGRQGRRWESPAGGLYATLAFSCPPQPWVPTGLSLAIGVGMAEALEALGAPVLLKWPNDLLASDGRKLGGILIELVSGSCAHAMVGVGLNLEDVGAVEGAVSLRQLSGRAYRPLDMAARLCVALATTWRQFLDCGFAAFRDCWMKRATGIGGPIRIDTGSEIISGTMSGVDERGALIVETSQGPCDVVAGHVLR